MKRSARRLPGALVAALLTAVATAGLASGAPTAVPAPKRSTPVTILYTGSFVMTNTAVPQGTTHSYTFKVTWTDWWTGTWAGLFRDPSVFRAPPQRFSKVAIAGSVQAAYKERVDDQSAKTCSMRIVRDNANRPTLAAAYDTSANTLQVIVEAPTFRGIKLVGSTDPNCQGGPGVNVFGEGTSQSPPSYVKPLGEGATVRLSTGGSGRSAKSWSWRHTFASAGGQVPYRQYEVALRSVVTVTYTPCRLITACARAKP